MHFGDARDRPILKEATEKSIGQEMTQKREGEGCLRRLDIETVRLHNEVGQEFLAGRFHLRFGFGGVRCFQPDANVLADAHIVHLVDAQIVQAKFYGLALGIEDFFNGHDVDFGDELHGGAY